MLEGSKQRDQAKLFFIHFVDGYQMINNLKIEDTFESSSNWIFPSSLKDCIDPLNYVDHRT